MMWYIWFFILEAVVIVTGNVTVLVVFTRTPALRKRKHFLLVSLAMADLLVGLISVPMYVTMSLIGFRRAMYQTQDILFGTASVFGLTAVAIERAYAVYFPYKHRTLWKGVYVIGIAVIWVMAACVAFASRYLNGLFWVCAVMIPLAVSLAIMVISYLLIWVKMNCMAIVQGHAIQGRDKRLTVMLLIVTVISLIAWIPFQVVIIFPKLCPECLFGKYIFVTTTFLHYCNSLVNPIIYALRMPQFKTAVANAVRCCQQHQFAVQGPNGRPQPNRARVIPLTTNYNKAFDIDDCEDDVIRDQTQRNENTNTAQASRVDEIQTNDTNL